MLNRLIAQLEIESVHVIIEQSELITDISDEIFV